MPHAETVHTKQEEPLLTLKDIQDEMDRFYAERGVGDEKQMLARKRVEEEHGRLSGILSKFPAGKKIALGLAGLTFLGTLGGAVPRAEAQNSMQSDKKQEEKIDRIIGKTGEYALRELIGKGIANDLFSVLETRDFSNGQGEAFRKKVIGDTLTYQLQSIPKRYEGGKALSPEETRVMLAHIADQLARLDQQKYKNYSERPELLQKNMRALIEVLKKMRSAK